ncbi:TPA: nucleotidyltransferase [Streptococcus equi subsp. zooepidemicus]|uniref:nucleotidyltransferase n=1 Tax=Streptococcus equi TaxID=1336 RepID=UPI00030C395F|nr:nucleotidyltransferase [Streptococcus equi]HEL0164750.1 nucleotidyltransferase [Streptococcus equi subsp. zooepidemicus]HEL0170709.1 nucleotidyltransferase [Streptococcus equi subsp. zooepidemicus]HEL0186741.1 nucleotidyltransferase [Streptococcus equi subsp. zooepidemicus]HEL0192660.1 nucleotidyltransferase [Streptococcus equi subsp. zooepidemicus]HEL0198747.1 nucleotidyltransferase [Streptococcus equi subsp. zooepidemicus]
MTVTGIIAEFNPFHYGHQYLLSQAKGLKIVAMSGNFVQRGEPALVDKWVRAQMALENGADLVVELPFLVSVQSADYFAQGAVDILMRLGIDTLAFGTEQLFDYQKLSRLYSEQAEHMTAYLATLPDHLSYPQKTQSMWEAFAGLSATGDRPNHLLALSYVKASAGKKLQLQPIKRLGAGFHSEAKDQCLSSATAIRKHIADRAFVEKSSPNAALILRAPQVTWEHYFPLLKYHILTSPDLTEFFQVNDELASRISAAIRSIATVDELVEAVATKHYTKARVRRVLTYILVKAVEAPLPEGIHVLGFSKKGQAHLKTIKASVPLISRIGAKPWDQLTQRADTVYQLGHMDMPEQTWGRVPIRPEAMN